MQLSSYVQFNVTSKRRRTVHYIRTTKHESKKSNTSLSIQPLQQAPFSLTSQQPPSSTAAGSRSPRPATPVYPASTTPAGSSARPGTVAPRGSGGQRTLPLPRRPWRSSRATRGPGAPGSRRPGRRTALDEGGIWC